ncbi:MAG: PaaI family thioesterase [Oceanicaulis sp.]|nr:PaaI family thioesterase [Oceanicaulis sp.]
MPAVTRHFGFSLIDLDPEAHWVEAWFEARPDFLNPNGSVQGGIVTGFLDEAMSLSAFIAGDLKIAVPTLEMKTSFLRPLMTDRRAPAARSSGWAPASPSRKAGFGIPKACCAQLRRRQPRCPFEHG